jgi:hypothetical protein
LQQAERPAALCGRHQGLYIGVADRTTRNTGNSRPQAAPGNQGVKSVTLARCAMHPDGELAAISQVLRDPRCPECTGRP